MKHALVLPQEDQSWRGFASDAPVVIITSTGTQRSELVEAIDGDSQQFTDAVVCPEGTHYVCILDRADCWHLYEVCARKLSKVAGRYKAVLFGDRMAQACIAVGQYHDAD